MCISRYDTNPGLENPRPDSGDARVDRITEVTGSSPSFLILLKNGLFEPVPNVHVLIFSLSPLSYLQAELGSLFLSLKFLIYLSIDFSTLSPSIYLEFVSK
ncbi:hypothetical protein AMTRI_Chr03g139730 [Amborella trichopoda]